VKLTPPSLDPRYMQATAIQANLYHDPGNLAAYWTLTRAWFRWDEPHRLLWLCRRSGGMAHE
jgi:hypothetical protein